MTRTLRASTFRLAGGGVMFIAALAIAVFVLPDASQKKGQQQKAYADAKTQLERKKDELGKLKARADSLQASRESMEKVLSDMPKENEGQLKWKLSRAIYRLSSENGVRIQNVKYGAPTREGAKGTDLEALDVEFVASGLYQNLKAFMHALEGNNPLVGLASGKLEETPEGARLTITLRTFRRTGLVKGDASGEEA